MRLQPANQGKSARGRAAPLPSLLASARLFLPNDRSPTACVAHAPHQKRRSRVEKPRRDRRVMGWDWCGWLPDTRLRSCGRNVSRTGCGFASLEGMPWKMDEAAEDEGERERRLLRHEDGRSRRPLVLD